MPSGRPQRPLQPPSPMGVGAGAVLGGQPSVQPPVKLLMVSCHEILEYDELRLFSEDLGIECYSIGAYTQPGGDHHRKRPSLPDLPYDPHFIELALQHPPGILHPEMLEMLSAGDVIMFMHQTHLLRSNRTELLNAMGGGVRVIYRSIGQSGPEHEMHLRMARDDGMEIVRYSPTEATISGYAGADATIRFYKGADDFPDWSGDSEYASALGRCHVVNFTQSMAQRGDHCGWAMFQAATQGLPWKIFGPGNEHFQSYQGENHGGILLGYIEQLSELRRGRAYFYTGTYPASYTLTFVEAGMAGIPIVAVGPQLGNGKHLYPWQECYEAHLLLDEIEPGYASDDLKMCNALLSRLLSDPAEARDRSLKQRSFFERVFGRTAIADQWKGFLHA